MNWPLSGVHASVQPDFPLPRHRAGRLGCGRLALWQQPQLSTVFQLLNRRDQTIKRKIDKIHRKNFCFSNLIFYIAIFIVSFSFIKNETFSVLYKLEIIVDSLISSLSSKLYYSVNNHLYRCDPCWCNGKFRRQFLPLVSLWHRVCPRGSPWDWSSSADEPSTKSPGN